MPPKAREVVLQTDTRGDHHEHSDQRLRKSDAHRRSTRGRSLDEQGFTHCSFAEQVQLIADVIYRGSDDVVLVEIDPALVAAEIRVENLDGGAVKFPHIYGPLAVDAVVRWQDVPLGSDGRLLVAELVETG